MGGAESFDSTPAVAALNGRRRRYGRSISDLARVPMTHGFTSSENDRTRYSGEACLEMDLKSS